VQVGKLAFNKSSSLNTIQKYIQRGQIDKAIKNLESIIDIDPNDASLYIKNGDLYLRKGKKEEAKEAYNKAAQIYLKDGFNNRAIATYKMVSRIDPDDLRVNISIAELFEKQGLVGDALQQYKYVATINDQQKKYSEMYNILKKIVELEPDNAAAKIKIAEIHFRDNEKDEAYKVLSEISKFLKDRKQYSDLVRAFEMFLELAPQDKFILKEIASAYILIGNSEEGLKKIQTAQKLDPKDTGTLLILAETYILLNQHDDAESIYCDILRKDEKNYQAKFGLSKIFLKKSNVDEAVKELDTVFSEFEERGELSDLIDFYDEALKIKPKNINVLERLAEIYRYYNYSDKLTELYETLASIYKSSEQNEKADFLYQKILQLKPDHEKARKHLKKIGVEIAEEAVTEKEVDHEALNEHITEANVYLKYGLYEQAKEHIDSVLKENPDNIDAHIALKDIYLSQNQKDLAVNELFNLTDLCVDENKSDAAKFLNEILNIDPENDQAKVKLKDLGIVLEKKEAKEEIKEKPAKKTETFEGIDLIVEEPEEIKKKLKTEETLKEILEEAEFYFAENLYDDAKRIYKKVLLEEPYNSTAIERLELIERQTQGEKEKEGIKEEGLETVKREEEQLFDFAKELEESLPEDLLGPSSLEPAPKGETGKAEDIFSKFKKGIDEHIDSKDFDSHYNLGIAYKEMELLNDSIEEFKKALFADPTKIFECCTMLGMVSLETKRYEDAITYFEKVFKEVKLTSDKKSELRYELATAYKEAGRYDDALKNFNMISDTDPAFKDVNEMIQMVLEAKESTKKGEKTTGKRKISYV
jgi:tetratricopeptide (TPR) repeat protein